MRKLLITKESMLPSGNILRAARALAGLTAVELAALADVDQSTISRMESTGVKPVRGQVGTVDAVTRALEAQGRGDRSRWRET